MNTICRISILALSSLILLNSQASRASVFNAVQYLEPGQSALGFEPEFVLSNGAGLGATFRYATGINDLSNASFIIGTGGGPRQFRLGANATADFFPDIDGQPGIGVAVQAMWVQVSIQSAGTGITETTGNPKTQGRFETQLIPYLHNRFGSRGGDVEPFLAFPYGFSIRDGRFQISSALAVGSFFHMSRQVAYSMELNVAINNAESTLSGGVMYTFE
ncbi:MAG: hypothetical protein KGQ59_00980 [Bdellovibrionales bacterium]|nr:hypothetical protein [Bdellovibrionales bacterium]